MTPQTVLTACCIALVGTGLYFGPDTVASRVRGTVNDGLRPGLELARWSRESVGNQLSENLAFTRGKKQAEVAQLTEALAIEHERNLVLQICLAQRVEQQTHEQVMSPTFAKSRRLILPSLIEVAVLGDTIAEDWCAGRLLGLGSNAGIREKEIVLSSRKSKKTLIDVGDDESISTEDALLLGRCVIGKVEHVGRWTSTIQLITDAKYSGRAQLIRETPDGCVFEATEGIILKGQGGPLCKLEGIPAENSVHIHDTVFTKERDGLLPIPLYYGQVVEATLEPNDREWTVFVKPAPLPTRLTRVQVLRMVLNSERLALQP